MKTVDNITQIEKVNDVSFVIWCYWSGKAMSKNRLLSYNTLIKNIGVPVFLVTNENIHQIEKPAHPFHKAFPYLSDVHKSDYVRIYLLHHYGGGWHDIKATEVSFKDAWSEFSDPSIYMIGRPERLGGPAQVFDNDNRWMPDYWQDLISVTSWVGRPNSDLSSAMLNDVEALLDKHFDNLKKYPARHSREKKVVGKNVFSKLSIRIKNLLTGRNDNYPLPWTVFGNVFHPLNYKFKKNISLNLPQDNIKNAGIYHR
jgi:hypothetical protein